MTIDKLKEELSKFGTVQICKDGDVFTLLMTGDKLDNWGTCNAIQMNLLECVGERYPLIECMRNDKTFYCLVLVPKK